ncbi:hypothetical protein H1Q63_12430 [Desmonostoc muscorum CCALA 125]|nr:hypothetical protein [Desmonostoc muscorum CCALA 125]
MPKSYPEFRYSDWEWIVVHFPPAEREDMARTAWLIAQCSADEIAKHKQLDPRIVIPLCAIEFQDEINWEKLEEFQKEAEQFDSFKDFLDLFFKGAASDTNAEFLIFRQKEIQKRKNFVSYFINKITNNEYWKNLFLTLPINLQSDLLHRLIDYRRRPKRNDLRFIYKKSNDDKESKDGIYYRLIQILLLCTLLLFIFTVIMMIEVLFKQYNFWIKGLTGLSLYIFIFPIATKYGRQDYITFNLFGLLTFKREFYQFLRSSDPSERYIENYQVYLADAIANKRWACAVAMAYVVAMIRAGAMARAGFVAGAVAGAVVLAWPIAGSVAVVVVLAGAMFLSLFSPRESFFVFMFVAVFIPALLAVFIPAVVVVTGAGTGAGILTGVVLNITISAWQRVKNNEVDLRFLAIFSFPLFCWFPILVSFATIFLLRFFSWQYTLLIWFILFGTLIGLWLYREYKKRKGINPLKGILETDYN